MKANHLLAIPLLAGTVVLGTDAFATAGTVNIQDDANVLDVTQVQNAADSLPVPLCVWTTTQDAANKAAFDSAVSSRVNQTCPVVIGINTQAHHLSIRMDKYAGLSQSEADSVTGQADSAFTGSMRSSNDNYTTATVAAVNSMRGPLVDAHNRSSGQPARATRQRHSSVLGFLLPLIILGAGAYLVARLLRRGMAARRGTMANPGYPPNYPQGGPGYGPQYGPNYPGPGYGPGYGGGYGGGGGIGAGMAGIGGGLLGYELGKEMGADRQFRDDQSGYSGGGSGSDSGGYDNSGGGDWTSGQDADFGGGDFGGGGDNSGGGGDW